MRNGNLAKLFIIGLSCYLIGYVLGKLLRTFFF